MMIGFVVRRCTVAMGREPTPEEFAAWANHYREGKREVCLFGRPITTAEARIILRHRARAVTARSARPHECLPEDGLQPMAKVTSFAAAAARVRARRKSGA